MHMYACLVLQLRSSMPRRIDPFLLRSNPSSFNQIEIVKVDAKADAKVKVVEAEKPEKKVEVVEADAKAEVRFVVLSLT